jgi:uncharacterized protein (DUF58 family)
VSPSPRLAALLAAAAVGALLVPPALAGLVLAGLLGAGLADALAARRGPRLARAAPRVLSRGVPAPLTVAASGPAPGRLVVRQPAVPDLALAAGTAPGALDTTITARRRGRHVLPPAAARVHGPLGLGRWDHPVGGAHEVSVFPDLHAARRLVAAVRSGRRPDSGLRSRGPIGLGTEFDLVRDYLPDDDIRQVNWRATSRTGRPMSNQYRQESERDVVLLVDAGRLMASPLGDRTRLDAALDAASAVALVADELGDRCGAVAFDDRILRQLPCSRGGGAKAVRALFDLEPSDRDADHELAFRVAGRARRAFVLVLTDLLDEAAAASLVRGARVLTARHHVVVAGVTDPGIQELASAMPETERDVLAAAVALDVLAARRLAAAGVRRAGAQVLDAPADRLAGRCVGAYLRAKARSRL